MTSDDLNAIKDIISEFSKKRVLVLGDIMLDKYIWGDVSRISPEAPIPIVQVQKDTSSLGGAGNVCENLKSLGASPLLVGVVGDDFEGEWIKKYAPDSRGVFTDSSRPSTSKIRIIAHQQQIVRVDHESLDPVPESIEKKIVHFIQNEEYDGMILSDYNKGLLSKTLVEEAILASKKKDIPLFVDPKVINFSLFSPVTLITPNHHEAERIVYHPCESDSDVVKAGDKILSLISAKYLILKRGEKGMTVFEKGKMGEHIPTHAQQVYDITGAGDTVIAAASLALLSGGNIYQAAFLANAAAGIVVGKMGTASLSSEELLSALL
jgi:D-beta-D-heptose 7-phosphate kinase/D-beta-D-heptose 1-phosphate adenosyltransferase